MPFAVAGQKALDARDGFGEVVDVGQEDDAEMVVGDPVEAGALHHQHLLLGQQFVGELLVVGDRVDLGVEAREHVQRRLGLDHADAGDLRQQLVGQVALLAQPPARCHQVLDALVAAQRGLDRQLPRRVGTQPQRGQHVQALDVVAGVALFTRDHHPAGAVAAGAVVLGQAVEADEEHVVGQAGQADVLVAVVQGLVVDLVGKHHQLVLARQLDDLQQQLGGIERAGGVVGVADHDAARALADLAAHVLDVGQPARGSRRRHSAPGGRLRGRRRRCRAESRAPG